MDRRPPGVDGDPYDPVTEEIDSLGLPPASGPVDVQVSATGSPPSVWVAAGREPSVFLIDPAHPKRPPRTFGTGGDMPTALAVAPDGSAWVASEQSDSVLAITPAGMIRAHQALGDRCDGPTGIAATGEAVWVSLLELPAGRALAGVRWGGGDGPSGRRCSSRHGGRRRRLGLGRRRGSLIQMRSCW